MTCPSPLLPLRYPFRVKSTTTSFVYAFALVSSLNRYRRRLHPPIRAAGSQVKEMWRYELAPAPLPPLPPPSRYAAISI